jgi:dienelactone hydrolase
MRRVLLLLMLLVGLAAATGSSATTSRSLAGTWTGSFRLPLSAEGVGLAVQIRGSQAVVVLPPGHSARTTVPAKATHGRLSFRLPGRSAPVVLSGRPRKKTIVGTVRQGPLRGTFRLHRGRMPDWGVFGIYTFGDGRAIGVLDTPFFPRTAAEFDSGELHAIYPLGRGTFEIGAALGTRRPSIGRARFGPSTLVWRRTGAPDERATRLPLRQEEVRFRSVRGAWIAGTLTMPAGPGPHPAVAVVHGSGVASRSTTGPVASFFARHGFAVLAYDKRGVRQSGGVYPGALASESTIDILARDAEAAARFLAAQPEVDDARIGLQGVSQAGWIMPLAASRETAIRFLVLLVSPLETPGENSVYQELTGAGAEPPRMTPQEIDAEVRRRGPSGFDPMPAIKSLRIPAIWVYGGLDMHVATRISVERLRPIAQEPGRDFSWVVLPGANHSLVHTAQGLNEETPRADRFAAGFLTTVRDWLRARSILR